MDSKSVYARQDLALKIPTVAYHPFSASKDNKRASWIYKKSPKVAPFIGHFHYLYSLDL